MIEKKEILAQKLAALLKVRYDSKKLSISHSPTTFTVSYYHPKSIDIITLFLPLKEWTADAFMDLEDKIVKMLDFCIEQIEE